ncbi:MAG: immunoglobulin domain-containing protein [Spirochaetota bacterium]
MRAHTVGVLLLLIALSGCDLLMHQPSVGSVQLSIVGTEDQARSIGPAISVDVDRYVIRGESDSGDTFEMTSPDTQVVIDGLTAGYWNITVDAFNEGNVHLYTGTQRALVEGGVALPLMVSLVAVPGTGTLTVGMSWPASALDDPTVEAVLVPAEGDSIPLAFATAGTTASFSGDQIPTGFHTLIIKLKEGDMLVAGAVELVHIVGGHTTEADLTFDQVNAPGSLEVGVEVTPSFSESLVVTIDGGEVTQQYGTPVTLTGSVEGSPSNAVFTWYLNGVAVDTGTTETVIDGDVPGFYRVDLIVVNADGTDGGMATTWVEIAQPGV